MAWLLIHIREDPTDTRNDAYINFPADVMFTTNSEFAINQQLMIAYLAHERERVLFIGRLVCQRVHVFFITVATPSATTTRKTGRHRLPCTLSLWDACSATTPAAEPTSLILSIDRMTIREECVFLTLRHFPRSYIYTVLPVDPFDSPTMSDSSNGLLASIVAYVRRDSVGNIGVVFNV